MPDTTSIGHDRIELDEMVRNMVGMESAIEQTIIHPNQVVESISDSAARLYYRFYMGTMVGDKYLCVVVKVMGEVAFVLTAYLTDRMKRGVLLWPERT